jgi:hypothetical protein
MASTTLSPQMTKRPPPRTVYAHPGRKRRRVNFGTASDTSRPPAPALVNGAGVLPTTDSDTFSPLGGVLEDSELLFNSCISWPPGDPLDFDMEVSPEAPQLYSSPPSSPTLDLTTPLPFFVKPDSPPPGTTTSPFMPAAVVPARSGLHRSLEILEANSHAVRLRCVQQVQGDKATGNTYEGRVKNYEKWWTRDQLRQQESDPSWTPIPPFPITPAKVVMFLEHEMTREKVRSFSFPPLFRILH